MTSPASIGRLYGFRDKRRLRSKFAIFPRRRAFKFRYTMPRVPLAIL